MVRESALKSAHGRSVPVNRLDNVVVVRDAPLQEIYREFPVRSGTPARENKRWYAHRGAA
jgi:hypothetical protein